MELNDHARVATSSATIPTFDALQAAVGVEPEHAEEADAQTDPLIRLGCWPRSAANTPIHNGADATATAARPEDTDFSARLTMPLPSSSNSTPIAAALRHWLGRRGHAAPAQEREHQRAGDDEADAAEQERRKPAFQREADGEAGGTQIRYTAASASSTRPPLGDVGWEADAFMEIRAPWRRFYAPPASRAPSRCSSRRFSGRPQR